MAEKHSQVPSAKVPNNGGHSSRPDPDSSTREDKQPPIPTTTPPLPPIEFPKFSGDDFSDWLYRCNRFFEIYNVSDALKVNLVSLHLEGEALRWHQKYIKKKEKQKIDKNLVSEWEEYVKQISIKFGSHIIEIDSGDGTESKRPRRLIRKLQRVDENDRKTPQFKTYHIKFGPNYVTSDDPKHQSALKEEAWEIVLQKSGENRALTKEVYSSAVRIIYDKAKACYPKEVTESFTEPEFRWMMIKDGCFFLQLVLYLLEESSAVAELGYPGNHSIFGKPRRKEEYKYVSGCIESMFFVGNQIPFVVLQVLLKQKYFQNVIKKGTWKKPSNISEMALYELLLFPELVEQSKDIWKPVKKLFLRLFDPRVYWLLNQEINDLLHGLQLMILGPPGKVDDEDMVEVDNAKSKGNSEDLNNPLAAKNDQNEDNVEDQNALLAVDDISSQPATALDQEGMCFCNCCSTGSRGICFLKRLCFSGCPMLCLPTIQMSDDTEFVFESLVNYEISQEPSIRGREFCSYVAFMSELIKTPEDARLMADSWILPSIIKGKGKKKQKHKLPEMLKKMAPKETYNSNIRRVKIRITDYTMPPWKKYWQVLLLGFAISVTSLTINILNYLKKKKS